MWLSISVLTSLLAVGLTVKVRAQQKPSLTLGPDYWALLACGSRNYTNYRHQADVAHGYHAMLNLGIPADRIIVMMFDDVAFDKENPYPGILINKPNGPDVYKGLVVDYEGWDVSAENFLKVLTGNKTAMRGIGTGRVIESGPDSTVLVYFTDHGGPGVLFFPDYEILGADDLHHALQKMHQNKQYDKMILFIEACYVGSVFEEIIEENANILVFSSTGRDEGSYPWYCENNNMTSCKGDEFSIKLFEYMDSVTPGEYKTLNELYMRVRTGVSHSHVNLYGDLSLGLYSFTPNILGTKPVRTGSRGLEPSQPVSYGQVDASIFHFEQKIAHSKNLQARLEAQKQLDDLKKGRRLYDELMAHFVTIATAGSPDLKELVVSGVQSLNLDIFPCYKKILDRFHQSCSSFMNEYALSQYYKFANICMLNIDSKNLLDEMPRICKQYENHTNSS